MAGCFRKDDPEPDPGPTYTLNGYWDRGDIVVHINGSTGTFYQINSGHWKMALNQGMITIGSLKFRYLIKLKDDTYTGQNLWCYYTSTEVQELRWSETGEFKLQNYGNTLFVTTKDPWEGDLETGEYTRINP